MNTEQKCSAGSDLTDHCSGCTDPRSEGTHQGCTKEHGHVGCNLSHTEQKGWKLDTYKDFPADTLCCNGDYCVGRCDEERRQKIVSLIERTVQEEARKAVLAYQEELVKKIEALPRHLVERHATDPTIIGAVTLEDIRALIKDTKPL